MTYTAEISRENPSCFLFMIDQSTSMCEEISAGDATQQKATGVADPLDLFQGQHEVDVQVRITTDPQYGDQNEITRVFTD